MKEKRHSTGSCLSRCVAGAQKGIKGRRESGCRALEEFRVIVIHSPIHPHTFFSINWVTHIRIHPFTHLATRTPGMCWATCRIRSSPAPHRVYSGASGSCIFVCFTHFGLPLHPFCVWGHRAYTRTGRPGLTSKRQRSTCPCHIHSLHLQLEVVPQLRHQHRRIFLLITHSNCWQQPPHQRRAGRLPHAQDPAACDARLRRSARGCVDRCVRTRGRMQCFICVCDAESHIGREENIPKTPTHSSSSAPSPSSSSSSFSAAAAAAAGCQLHAHRQIRETQTPLHLHAHIHMSIYS